MKVTIQKKKKKSGGMPAYVPSSQNFDTWIGKGDTLGAHLYLFSPSPVSVLSEGALRVIRMDY